MSSGHFLGYKILNFNVFWGFRKMNIFWVSRFCGYIFGHYNIGIYLGVISMHFRVFFKVKIQNGEYFFSCKNFKYLGVFEIPNIFWGER